MNDQSQNPITPSALTQLMSNGALTPSSPAPQVQQYTPPQVQTPKPQQTSKVNYPTPNLPNVYIPVHQRYKASSPQNPQKTTTPTSTPQGPQKVVSPTQKTSATKTFNPKAPYADLIMKYFPQQEWGNAQAIMQAESSANPKAVGDNYPIKGQTIPSYGLFQIRSLPGRPSSDQLQDAEFNVKYAAQMQAQQGWKPWSTSVALGLS